MIYHYKNQKGIDKADKEEYISKQLNDCSTVGGKAMKNTQYTCDCEVIHDDVVAKVRATMPDGDELYELANLYKVFADNTRIKILWALTCEKMCVCDLAVLLDMTKSAISHQLKTLRLAGVVKYDKQGKEVYYSLADDSVKEVFKRMKP